VVELSAPVKFGSVCSGIEAASAAFNKLGWEAAWFSEIESWPSTVLAKTYPTVPNLGDMLTLPERILAGSVEAPDVLCGGTPCQAFSVAGLRASLEDARGNLSLTFCEIANAIDTVRSDRGEQPCTILWENVPGVYSVRDNAFGCFLAGLAGEDIPLVAPGGKWTNAGYVLGPKRAVAWRTLDAQHFGVPQRRRRVFVVASAAEGFDPLQVLFEFEGVRRDTAPSRRPEQETATTLASGSGGVDRDDTLIPQAYDVANCLTRRMHKGINTTLDEGQTPVIAYRVAGDGAAYDGGELVAPLTTGTDRCANLVGTYSTKLHNTASNGAGQLYQDYVPSLDANSPPPAVFVKGTNPHSKDEAPTFRETDTAACLNGWDERHNPPKHIVTSGYTVRRLTPMECERLQGFADGYTDHGSDTARYKALGNSWPVPVVRWIGGRIDQQLRGTAQ
jgi:DNA (cytosine-5)-methyltransferase 1